MRHGVTQDLQTAFAMDNATLLEAMRDPELERAWLDAMKVRLTWVDQWGRLTPCTRTMRLYAEIRKLVGTQPALTLNLIAELGASSEIEARRAIQILKDAEATPLEERVQQGCQWLLRVLREHPEFRGYATELLEVAACAVPLAQLEAHANGAST